MSTDQYINPIHDQNGVIWLDGQLVPWREATVHGLNYTLHYGLGVFEGVRAYRTDQRGACIFRLADHTRRLFCSAKIMRMPMPYTMEELNEAQRQVVSANQIDESYIRPLCFYTSHTMGIHAAGLQPHVLIAAWHWPSYMEPEVREKGVAVKVSSYTRHNVNSAMSKAKVCGHYVNSILAMKEVEADGYAEALLLDNEGYVSEGSGENIFIVHNGTLYTPDLATCLAGITRDTILTIARDCGIPTSEKRITRDELIIADEAFFTGTAAEVLPICSVDGIPIGEGKRGKITAQLQSLYFDTVYGRNNDYSTWLTPVDP